MPLNFLLIYTLSLAAAGAACGLALGLMRTFRLHFLSLYMGYLVAINTLGLLNLVVSGLAVVLLRDVSPENLRTVYIMFGLVGFPLLAIAYYFYLAFIAGILDREIPLAVRIAYFGLWPALFAGFLVRIQFSLQNKFAPVSQALGAILGTVMIAVPIAALAYFAVRTARSPRAEGKKGQLGFIAVSLVCFLLFDAAALVAQTASPLRWAVPFVLFLANATPVLALRRLLARDGRPVRPEMFADPRMQRFREEFRLSAREGEILDLLLRGKSNRDIERELYISHHTVRNHVHNVYQKLAVSSRLQLMNLVRTWFESAA